MSIKKNDRLIVVRPTTVGDDLQKDMIVYALSDEFDFEVPVSLTLGGKRIGCVDWMSDRFAPAPALDTTKPLETIGGRKFDLLTSEGREPYPIVGYLDGSTRLSAHKADGTCSSEHPALTLRNIVAKPLTKEVTGYVNVFKNADGTLRVGTVFEQDKPYPNNNAVGRVKVTFTAVEGEFAN